MMHGQTFMQANSSDSAYGILSAKGYAYEVPDCGHPVPHINNEWNADLRKYVFNFGMHRDLDNDRCINTDRQRIEIYKNGADSGQTIYERWKFRLDSSFQSSPNFCHLHQIKAADGTDNDAPIMTISTRYGANATDKLQIIYTPPMVGTTKATAVTMYQTALAPFKGSWVEVFETVTYGFPGKYNVIIKRLSDEKILVNYSNDTLKLWRTGANYTRPKFGLYRSLTSPTYLRDEAVLFADFSYQKLPMPILPGEPVNSAIASVSGNLVTLVWSDTSSNEDQFRIDRSPDGSTWSYLTTSPANSTSYTDTIANSGTYYYRVRGENVLGNSAYTDPLKAIISGINNNETKTIQKYQLEQNYPNPFNPSTLINYSVAHEGRIRITVYNVIGLKQITLIDESKPAGNYSVQFDGSKFPSGTYLYKLETNEVVLTKKMMLIK